MKERIKFWLTSPLAGTLAVVGVLWLLTWLWK